MNVMIIPKTEIRNKRTQPNAPPLILPPGVWPPPIRDAYERRAQRRASLRLASQRIAFFGRRRYRLAKEAMSLTDDVSIFDLDNDDLADLARRMREYYD